MSATLFQTGSILSHGVSPMFGLSAHLGFWGIPFATIGMLGFLWRLNRSTKNNVLNIFFHHRDRARRRKEIQMLWLALGLGLILAVGIAVAMYVLNVTNRI